MTPNDAAMALDRDGASFDDLIDDMGPAPEEEAEAPAAEDQAAAPQPFARHAGASFLAEELDSLLEQPAYVPPAPAPAFEPDPVPPVAQQPRPDFETFVPPPVSAPAPAPAPAPEPAAEPAPAAAITSVVGSDGTRTYRASSLEEIIPRIREELGPDAIILRQRDGLTGGVAGFFQRRCVEVEARAGRQRVDLYDTTPVGPAPFVPEPASPAPEPELFAPEPLAFEPVVPEPAPAPVPQAPLTPTEEGLSSPAIEALVRSAQPFAEQLSAAQATPAPQPAQVPQPAPVAGPMPVVPAQAPKPPKADALERKLGDGGIARELAAEIVGEAVSHRLPFAGAGRILSVVRDSLARRIPVEDTCQAAGRTIAVVGAAGAGKTAAVAAIASAYAAGSDLPVICLTLAPRDRGESLAAALRGSAVQPIAVANGAEAAAVVAEARGRALVVVDTPSLSPADPKAVTALRRELRALGGAEVHLALRAATSRPAAGEQASSFATLGASRIVLTHTAETAYVGPVVDLAISERTPLSFVSEGPGDVAPADAAELARRILA